MNLIEKALTLLSEGSIDPDLLNTVKKVLIATPGKQSGSFSAKAGQNAKAVAKGILNKWSGAKAGIRKNGLGGTEVSITKGSDKIWLMQTANGDLVVKINDEKITPDIIK